MHKDGNKFTNTYQSKWSPQKNHPDTKAKKKKYYKQDYKGEASYISVIQNNKRGLRLEHFDTMFNTPVCV